jgi:hypothetical protein
MTSASIGDDSVRVYVFDGQKKRFYVEGKDYLARKEGVHRTEFAGEMVDCSTRDYFCVQGGKFVAYPRRKASGNYWVVSGLSCERLKHDSVDGNGGVLVSCLFRSGRTDFDFVEGIGIRRFWIGSHEDPSEEFKLASSVGLLNSSREHSRRVGM